MNLMRRSILGGMILVSGIVLLSVLALVVGVFYRQYSQEYVKGLLNEAYSLSEAIDIGGMDYLASLDSLHRLTIVDPSGKVLYDSEQDGSSLENHLDQEEIRMALEEGEGYAERYSATLSAKMVNVAIRLNNGNVLRVAAEQLTVYSLLGTMAVPILVIFLLAAGLAMFLAARISRSIVAPINQLDLEHPEAGKAYKELAPLISRIHQQNQQIRQQIQDLQTEHEKQDSMRRDFTANVSHELKTPLTSISGYAEIIRDGIAREEDIPRFAGKIYDESRRLITLVGDIIKLSQLDADILPAPAEEIDLYTLCQDVLSQLELAAKEKRVSCHLYGSHLLISASEKVVEEIVFNLCDNAIKYNREGGTVSLSLRQCVDGIELSIQDTGVGIGEEDLPHVFDRFYRADKSHSKAIGGTGLGLSIVKHSVASLGASISIHSELGKGTTVRILF